MIMMKKYFLIFLACNITISILAFLLSYFADINFQNGIVSTLVSAFITGSIFCEDHSRLPTKAERKKLINGSFLILLIITIIGGGVLLLGSNMQGNNELESLNPSILIMAFLFASGLNYLVLIITYGWFLRITMSKKLNKNN